MNKRFIKGVKIKLRIIQIRYLLSVGLKETLSKTPFKSG